ncbi:hypothetical protein J4475_01195 [Candidatus Woesearchaeota archaeon]|nr:hypothetical protein [Candidatus Woesearchaeota archaeon]OGV92999.1 MAG: hypothetical protein A3B57_00735 [Microgenomates group bacterium RIFCSPLOWO2_01_FULL_47_10]
MRPSLLKRKGEIAQWMVVTMIIAVIGLLVLTFFLVTVNRQASENADRTICKQSVLTASKLPLARELLSKSINCEANQITLDKKMTGYQAKKAMADEMYYCWDSFGRGELNLFSDKDEVYCHVCSIISVSTEQPVTGLPYFLLKEPSPDRNQETYARVLKVAKSPNADKVLADFNEEEIKAFQSAELEPGRDYGVFFVYAKGVSVNQWLELFSNDDIPTGFIAGGTAGAETAVLQSVIAWTTKGPGGILKSRGRILGRAGTVGLVAGFGAEILAELSKQSDWMAMTVLSEFQPETFRQLGCTNIPV